MQGVSVGSGSGSGTVLQHYFSVWGPANSAREPTATRRKQLKTDAREESPSPPWANQCQERANGAKVKDNRANKKEYALKKRKR